MHKFLVIASFLLVCIVLHGQNDRVKASSDGSTLKVIILGSGGGPPVNLQRFGISILVEAGNEKLLFDCGRGVAFRLAESGIRLGEIDKVFLTHLHSDHIISVPDLLLAGWGVDHGRTTPFRIWGPAGTRSMMDRLQEAYAFDIQIRELNEKWSKQGISVESTDINEGVVYEKAGVMVTAFLVDHGPVKPAFGYRVDFRGRSIVMSGDTRFSENLIKFSQGVDVLIHEVGASRAQLVNGGGLSPDQVASIVNLHTSPEQTATVFNRVKPRLAVYAHGGADAIAAEAHKTYPGPLEVGEDLMTIDIGDKIEVHRRKR
jgi:ribonuclease Z